MVCSLPAAVALLLTQVVLPESPRFLIGKKKYKEAVGSDFLCWFCGRHDGVFL